MPYPSVTYTLTNGTANDAGPVNTNFSNLVSAASDGTKDYNVAAITCTSVTASTDVLIGSVSVGGSLVPIGSIIAFYDFGAALTFDTDNWVYCDGSTATVGGSSRTLPDLSGRYLVGFGGATDGAGDIDTATWATAAVGNSLHQVDIAHTHTGPSHTHTGPSHTHNLSDDGWAQVLVSYGASFGTARMNQVAATTWNWDRGFSVGSASDDSSGSTNLAAGLDGATDAGGTGNTGASGTGRPANVFNLPKTTGIKFGGQ